MSEVRVRFPPSPTGNLHIGGVRTALFNWLFARSQQGKFLLRIEDTDRERSKEEFTKDILGSLEWLGLNWDEPPVYQSQRFERYKDRVNHLLDTGSAYRCDCSAESLEKIRQQCRAEKRNYRYPGTCREKSEVGSTFVVRLKNEKEGDCTYSDLLRGEITIHNSSLDDWIIQRSDGSPTYNFCVVVDDADQKISHVLRGDDHINNTPKQVGVYKALNLPVPQFGHFPMILGPDKAKLSKRHGAASTLEYRKMGYLPEAIVNFLVRLGWSHGDQELFSTEELKKLFNLKSVGKSNAVFNQDKLDWIAGHHMQHKPADQLVNYLFANFPEESEYLKPVPSEALLQAVKAIQPKVKTVVALIEQLSCLFGEEPKYCLDQLKPGQKEKFSEVIRSFLPIIKNSPFSVEALETNIRQHASDSGIKFGKVAPAIRFAMTGGKVSPGLFDMLSILGKEKVVGRLHQAEKALG